MNQLQVARVEAGTSQNAATVIQCRDDDALGQALSSECSKQWLEFRYILKIETKNNLTG